MLGQRVHSDDHPFGPDTPAAEDFISAIGPYTSTGVAVASRPSPKSDQPKGNLIFYSTSRRSESIASPSRETTKPSRPKGRAAGCTVSRDRWCNSCTLFPWFQRRLRRGRGPKLLRRWPRALGRSRPSGSSGRLRRARHTILAGRWLALRP